MRPRLTHSWLTAATMEKTQCLLFVLDVFATPEEGSQVANKCLMICFDSCNKFMTGLSNLPEWEPQGELRKTITQSFWAGVLPATERPNSTQWDVYLNDSDLMKEYLKCSQ